MADINRSNKSLTQINFITLKYYIDILKNNKNLKKIIYTSSIHKNLDNDYGRSKRKNEKELKLFCKIKKIDLKVIILEIYLVNFVNQIITLLLQLFVII